ncbi:DNA-directed RNA polymerase subunit omega [Alicyclobacillus fastidiosus]|uniref:DNA-directed RNA polymerase subunit omega n=1 Tax=Alicyclobacillus fastidiosus TaxID=392011 RepID=A0ABV5AI83_9BACL|nr:DNA-directed RNA polymerase subunit omega [Alicyclobacillus fastidiosus]WEH08086.1 DNA-directed RNA polymerase subunit omega [Alicyclobacillus fastidiosus]
MLYPSIDKLIDLTDSKYALVVVTAKRARKLQTENINQVGSSTTRNVSRALWEIYNGDVTTTNKVKQEEA